MDKAPGDILDSCSLFRYALEVERWALSVSLFAFVS